MTEHSAIVGGSTASRVMACPASVKLAAAAPKQSGNEYTDIGTLGHTACEKVIEGEELDDLIGVLRYTGDSGTYTLTQELANTKVIPALAALDEVAEQYDVEEVYAETRVEFTERGLEKAFGTIDVLMLGPYHAIFADFKFGDGVQVYPDSTDQLPFYAAAALSSKTYGEALSDYDNFVLVIIQPNERDAPTLRQHTVTRAELEAFTRKLKGAVDEALNGNPEPVAGDHCRWCPAAATCKTTLAVANSALRLNLDAVPDLTTALTLVDQVDLWAKRVREMAHKQLEAGVELEGFKLVNKRGQRQWKNPDEVAELLTAHGVNPTLEPKLVSPAQAEKLLKDTGIKDKTLLDDYVITRSSGTSIVKDDDKRAAALPRTAITNALRRMKL